MNKDVVNPKRVISELSKEEVAIVIAIGSVSASDICRKYIDEYAIRTDNIIVPNPYTTLRFFFCDGDVCNEEMLRKDSPEYQLVREMFHDKESLKIFQAIMDAKLYNGPDDDYELVLYDDIKDVYYYDEAYGFEKFMPHDQKYATVLDCGAYIGDSIKDICNEVNAENILYYAFEPQSYNYNILINDRRLEEYCSELRTYNCGLGEKDGKVQFMIPPSGARDGGHIVYCEADKNSKEIMECTIKSIDNMGIEIRGNLFIKMDIEGAELSALKGAYDTIMRYHPCFSICVHHRKNDITEIPLFIKGLGLDYDYYLIGGYHTILLAIPRK